MSGKSGWDKFSIISNFIAGVVIAIIAIVFTVRFSEEQNNIAKKQTTLAEKQIQISQLQALETFIPYLNHENSAMKKFAAERIAEIAGPDYATKLADIYQTDEVSLVAEKARATGLGVGQTVLPQARTANITRLNKEGWAYLGHFEDDRWKTRYFKFAEDVHPDELENTSQVVWEKTGALNVRKGMPDLVGQFPQVIDVLIEGSTVKIMEVREWYSSGYMWANIKYSGKN